MANTRQSAKRARQTVKRTSRNQIAKSAMKTAVRNAVDAILKKETATVEAYRKAVQALSKASTRGTIPKKRASRKISRLTLLLKKHEPKAASTSSAKTK